MSHHNTSTSVRELVWRETPYLHDGKRYVDTVYARTPIEYTIIEEAPGCWKCYRPAGTWGTIEEAKAACQSDFQKRITECLEPTNCEPKASGWRDIESFQDRVRPWIISCFGEDIAADKLERCDRFIEEALELVQAVGYGADRAQALVDYTFSRPAGEPAQEVGGVMVTLAAFCLAHDLDMHSDGDRELARISAPEVQERIRAKQQAKPTGSALPAPLPPPPGQEEDPLDRLQRMGQGCDQLDTIYQDAHRASVRSTIATSMKREEALRAELYQLKLLIAGGEDAPGHANVLTVRDADEVLATLRSDESDYSDLQARYDKLEAALASARQGLMAAVSSFADFDGSFDAEAMRSAGLEADAFVEAEHAAHVALDQSSLGYEK